MKKITYFALFTVTLLASGIAYADDCNNDCPSGRVKASFLDGSHVTCQCVEPGVAMEDNPPDGNPPSGGEGQET